MFCFVFSKCDITVSSGIPWFLPLATLVDPGPDPWCPHNIPLLAEEHQAVPVGASDRSDGCFLQAADLICLDFFFFFWLWSKMFSCHHFTVFSSNPFFKHGQRLVDLSPPPPPPPTPISTQTRTPLSPITVLFCLEV